MNGINVHWSALNSHSTAYGPTELLFCQGCINARLHPDLFNIIITNGWYYW